MGKQDTKGIDRMQEEREIEQKRIENRIEIKSKIKQKIELTK